jgi:hypothetical protein
MAWIHELQALEDALRSLNAQYDAFLFGSTPRPPVEIRRRVATQIRRLSTSEPDSSAERYRFSTLQGRYNALCERWDRLQAEKEAGKRPGVYGHFTRTGGGGEIERILARSNVGAPGSVQPEGGKPSPAAELSAEKDLFERYKRAKLEHGEDIRALDFDRFVERLVLEKEKLKQHFGVNQIEFVIAERDGRVRLVARPKESKV